MTVLVTGGLGFIGSKVVLQLLKKDIDVLVTDLDIVKNKDKLESSIIKIGKNKDKVKYQKLDITNYKEIENNPAHAINLFLKEINNCYKILCLSKFQLFIEKTK